MPDTAAVQPFLTERHLELAGKVAAFARHELAPLPEPVDDAACRREARSILDRLGALGWLAPISQQDLRACCLIRESLAAASPLADAVFALQALGATPIALMGNAELRQRWLEPAVTGRAMAAFAMTELEAGSDVTALATTARRDGDGYRISGQKTLISNAGIADFYVVFASTNRQQGKDGISAFLVPADTPGFRYVGPQVLSAPHPLGEIAFDDCRVPATHRLGREGEGLKLGLRTLDRLRATVGAAACGMADRALAEALDHATHRRQFGKTLAEFQLTQEKLARMATDLAAARLLVYRAAWAADQGAERVTLESAMAKAFATEAAQRVVDDAVQILGGRGVLASHPVDRLYRAVRALRIYEGTTEMQYLTIARHLLARHGEDAPRAS